MVLNKNKQYQEKQYKQQIGQNQITGLLNHLDYQNHLVNVVITFKEDQEEEVGLLVLIV